jgi:hypothetical protein
MLLSVETFMVGCAVVDLSVGKPPTLLTLSCSSEARTLQSIHVADRFAPTRYREVVLTSFLQEIQL